MDDGRKELSAAAGKPLLAIAYPHGRADARVANAARRAGLRSGSPERLLLPPLPAIGSSWAAATRRPWSLPRRICNCCRGDPMALTRLGIDLLISGMLRPW